MPLSVTNCSVTNTSITISFSDPVFTAAEVSASPAQWNSNASSALNPANYSIFDPGSAHFTTPRAIDTSIASPTLTSDRSITISFVSSGSGADEFQPGDWINIIIKNVAGIAPTAPEFEGGLVAIARQVPGTTEVARVTRDVEDAISYPILTEEIGYRPSPVGIPTGGGAGGVGNLGQVALKAVSDVLGWKANADDPKGFVGALTQSFTLTDVEGHVESKWSPRTYAVQTDLGGGITGAQASLYMRAKDALDTSLPLLNGLYPLDPEADPEYVKALREMVRSQMTEIIKELGEVGLPSILRIDTYFGILLGQNPAQINSTPVQFDPDEVGGTLGKLRDTYGIYFQGNPFNNSVEDEQDITNFRVISDYMTSLMQSWIANRQFFVVGPGRQAFFGTQLVLISRQFNVIAETVNEVRFALDSVFIGPNERQTLLLDFTDDTLPPMFLEDVLEEVEKFVTEEGPRLLRDGGKISVTNNILPVVHSLQNLVEQAHDPENIDDLPGGFKTARVRNSLSDLEDQLEALFNLTEQVEQEVPASEEKVAITGISGPTSNYDKTVTFALFGEAFSPASEATVNSSVATAVVAQVDFFSAQRIDITFDPTELSTATESHDITVTNPGGDTVTVSGAFTYVGGAINLAKRRVPRTTRAPGATGKAIRPAAPSGLSASTGARPIPPVGKPGGSPSARPAAADLHEKMVVLQQSHEALARQLGDMQRTHETFFQKVADFFEGKGKKGKDKDD